MSDDRAPPRRPQNLLQLTAKSQCDVAGETASLTNNGADSRSPIYVYISQFVIDIVFLLCSFAIVLNTLSYVFILS